MNNLGGVTNASVRDSMGDRSFTKAGLAIHGSNAENVLTAAAVTHCCDGVFQTAYAQTNELDLSAVAVLNRRGESVSLKSLPVPTETVTNYYVLACKGTTPYIIDPQEDNASQDNTFENLVCPSGYAPWGVIKLVRTTAAAEFTLGTTDLDATGVTATFSDVSALPANVANLA